MNKEKILEMLSQLIKEFKDKMYLVAEERHYMRTHNFKIEDQALDYKEEAYRDAWLAVFQLKEKIENETEE